VSNQPTIFHITHWKAGSQWVYQVLRECAPSRIVEPKVKVAQFYEASIVPGAIYPTVYVSKPRFENILKPELNLDVHTQQLSADNAPSVQNWHNFVVQNRPVVNFVILRDIRDALISLYFSLKISHPIISENVAEGRRKLKELSFEDGFLNILRTRGRSFANIQHSWLPACEKGDALLVRYEDLLMDEQRMFAKIIEHCQIDVKPSELKKIVQENSFENKTGRSKGIEDIQSHYRKGITGDWRNHFTERIKDEFKQKFGELLIKTGYEKNLNW